LEEWAQRFGSCEITKLEYDPSKNIAEMTVCYKKSPEAEDAKKALLEADPTIFNKRASKLEVLD
jgi:hypothetical protein